MAIHAIHVNTCKTWKYITIHGNTWQYMAIRGSTWSYMAINGNTWKYIVIHGNTWHTLPTETPRKVGKRKEPLPTSSAIHIEHAPNSNFSATSIKPLP